MDLQLKDKCALVTGSSSGIGVGVARILAREGATVVVHGRDEARTRAVADEINRGGGRALVTLGDLMSDDGAARVAEGALSQVGHIDILVNNAGGYVGLETPQWLDSAPESWIASYQQNTVSAVRMTLALVPGMRERKWGRIINLSTGGGMEPTAHMAHYCAAKAAVSSMTVSLSKALKNTGVTVNTISPGIIRNAAFEQWVAEYGRAQNWTGDRSTIESRFIEAMYPNTVGHAGCVDDIGNTIAFLVSPLSGFITGANIRVDGGQLHSVN